MNWTPSAELKRFIRYFGDALAHQDGALFAGAGVSRAAGYVDWRSLLRGIAKDLQLDVDRETDLVALTQFHVNERGTRSTINQVLIDELTRGAMITPVHQIVARLPIDTVWTTNYDDLLERSFEAAGKTVDVKRTTASLAQVRRGRDVTIYKMHGCITQPDEAVLTKDDYEGYERTRSLFSDSLKGDLIGKTFLFLGFSFTDPNIEQILARVRTLLGANKREHFCVLRRAALPAGADGRQKADFEYEQRKANHQSADLRRFGVQTLWIDEHKHLEPLLRALAAYVDRSSVFIAGSADDPMPLGAQRLESLAKALGARLVDEGFRLVSGFGHGIGEHIVLGSLRALYYQSIGRDEDRVLIRPFPRANDPSLQDAANLRHREDLISRVGTVIVLSGNRSETRGGSGLSEGVREEVRIAKRLGKAVIPVGVTGHVAADLWQEAMANPTAFFPGMKVDAPLSVLGDSAASDDAILDAVFSILKTVQQAHTP